MNWRVVSAQHAAERAAAVTHRRLARGLFGLATVSATAPFWGMLGTLLGIVDSFRGVCGDKSAIMGAIAANLSEALMPAAAGLVVATLAFGARRYLTARLAFFDTEMRAAILDLPRHLPVRL